MSYAIELAPEASAAIKSFDSIFAESILDGIDLLAESPASAELTDAYPYRDFNQRYMFEISNRVVTLFVEIDDLDRIVHIQNLVVQGG